MSNLFSTGDDKVNNTAFTQYQTLWGDGPNVPIFAKLYVKNSSDAKEDVPKAIGKVRLLWDWEDVPEDLSMQFQQASEYLSDTLDYYKKKTNPNGDNCHKDRGGKRGDDSKPVFPAQGGYAPAANLTAGSFPFLVERCTTRTWSSYAETWNTGKLMGLGGAMFQPSRMAGDAYKINVYFPHNRKPDGKDDLDTKDDKQLVHAIKATTGTFQIWRKIQIIKYLQKATGITAINLGAVGGYYDKAYIEVEDLSGGPSNPMPNYDANLRGALGSETAEKQLAVAAGDQGTITPAGILFISYSDFKTAVRNSHGWTALQLNDWLAANFVDSAAGYKDFLEAIADNAVIKACNPYFSASDGINIFQFNKYWTAGGGLSSGTNGFASTDFASKSRTKAGYLQTKMDYSVGNNSMQQTTTHEVGHIMFLPHASPKAGGAVDALHDQVSHWDSCIMSYNYDRERKFCGLCLLRLRGWDQNGLNSNRARNKKT